jgi:hypothetical protein
MGQGTKSVQDGLHSGAVGSEPLIVVPTATCVDLSPYSTSQPYRGTAGQFAGHKFRRRRLRGD